MLAVEYRDVPGFPGYRVGEDGSVWSQWQQRSLGIGKGTRTILSDEWNRLRPTPRKKCGGHLVVSLCRDGKRHVLRVHHLVLDAFVGPRPAGMQGCHFPDPDPANNRLGNLRWDTPKGNQSDRVAHGTTNRGERNGRSVLTESQVKEIRSRCGVRRDSCDATDALASEFGVSPFTIRDIVNRKRWGSVE